MTELKPCPFCGSEAVALVGPVKNLWGVSCINCNCWLDERSKTSATAIAAWNTRAPVPITDAMVDAACLAMLDIADALAMRMRAALEAALEAK